MKRVRERGQSTDALKDIYQARYHQLIASVYLRKIYLKDSALFLDPVKFGKSHVMTGIFNTPTLTKHASFNKAMEFTYIFEHDGVHQLVVAMLCISDKSRVLYMRKDFVHYRLTNEEELDDDNSEAKCLDIHSFLGSCEKFQVQFLGAARGSKLMVDDIYFHSNCRTSTCLSLDKTL